MRQAQPSQFSLDLVAFFSKIVVVYSYVFVGKTHEGGGGQVTLHEGNQRRPSCPMSLISLN